MWMDCWQTFWRRASEQCKGGMQMEVSFQLASSQWDSYHVYRKDIWTPCRGPGENLQSETALDIDHQPKFSKKCLPEALCDVIISKINKNTFIKNFILLIYANVVYLKNGYDHKNGNQTFWHKLHLCSIIFIFLFLFVFLKERNSDGVRGLHTTFKVKHMWNCVQSHDSWCSNTQSRFNTHTHTHTWAWRDGAPWWMCGPRLSQNVH